MKALVTGASGFIGQHLVQCLERNKIRVKALVRNSKKLIINNNNVNIFEGDIFNNEILRKAGDEADVVFHFVATTHVFSNTDNTKDYFKINVEGARNLLSACIDSIISYFIYFSSVKAMAENSEDTLDETKFGIVESIFYEND